MKSFYSYFKYIFFLNCILIIIVLGGFVFWQQTKINEWIIVNQAIEKDNQQNILNKLPEKGPILSVAEKENFLFDSHPDQLLIKRPYTPFDSEFFLRINMGLIILVLMILTLSYFIIYRIYIFPLPRLKMDLENLNFKNSPSVVSSRPVTFLNALAEKVYSNHFSEVTGETFKSIDSHLLNQNKTQALGGIAHEIRNPLNFIVNFTDISLEYLKELKAEQTEINLLKTLEQNLIKTKEHTKRIETIVESVLAQARGYRSAEEKINMNILIEEALDLTCSNFNEKYNLKLEKIYEKNLPLFDASKEELLSVFINIITNACFSMEEKYEKLGVDYQPCLKIETKTIKNTIKIAIEDNGCGIESLHLNKIFQPFFTTKAVNEGTGLGLAISQDIIRRHEGELTVDSEFSKFTVFTIIFPV